MSSPLTAYIALTSLSGVINLLLFLYVFLKRKTYGVISTFFLLGVAAKIGSVPSSGVKSISTA